MPTKRHRRTQFDQLGPVRGAIVFLGDSITEQGVWDEWFPDVLVSNRGIGAEVIDELRARLDTALDQPRAVFVLIGTNDLGNGYPVADVAARASLLLTEIIGRAGTSPVFVQSVMPRAATYAADVIALREEYRRLAETHPQATFVDLVPALAASDGALRPDLTLDGIHLNGEGYREWVAILRPLVAEIP